MTRSTSLAVLSLTLAAAVPLAAGATDVSLVGLFPGKAVVVIDGGAPRTLSLSTALNGVTLISTGSDSAVFDIDGKRRTLALGQAYAGKADAGRSSTTLSADSRGHFITQGAVNGNSVNFLVDTGATLIVMSAADAQRLGINYRGGRMGTSNTANGQVPFYLVRLDRVKVGDITLMNVDAAVQEVGIAPGMALLGMSFLNRTEMQRAGDSMVLTKRF